MSTLRRLLNTALGISSKSHEQKHEDSSTLQIRRGDRVPYLIIPIDGSFERGASDPSGTKSVPGGLTTHVPYCEVCDEYFPLESALYHHRLESCLEASNLSLCPICSVICSVSEHLTWAAHHRCFQKSPAGQPMLETEWPRSCSDCKATLRSPHDKEKHYNIIQRHNEIIRRKLVESAVDKTELHICWPCDRYFESEAGLMQHRSTCTSPLRYLTNLEGGLLAAISRDMSGAAAGGNNPSPQPSQESGPSLPVPSSSSHIRVGDILAEHSPRAGLNMPNLQLGDVSGANTSVPPSSAYMQVGDTVPGQHQITHLATTAAGTERRPSLQRTNLDTIGNESGSSSMLPCPLPFTPTRQPSPSASTGLRVRTISASPTHYVSVIRSTHSDRRQSGSMEIDTVTQGILSLPYSSAWNTNHSGRFDRGETDVGSAIEEGAPPSYLATMLQDRPISPVLDNSQRIQVSNTNSSSDARSPPISHHRIVSGVLSPSSPAPSSNSYECPLCLERGRDLSSIPCGHVFCTPCIMESLGMDQHCPLCRSPAQGTDARKVFLA